MNMTVHQASSMLDRLQAVVDRAERELAPLLPAPAEVKRYEFMRAEMFGCDYRVLCHQLDHDLLLTVLSLRARQLAAGGVG